MLPLYRLLSPAKAVQCFDKSNFSGNALRHTNLRQCSEYNLFLKGVNRSKYSNLLFTVQSRSSQFDRGNSKFSNQDKHRPHEMHCLKQSKQS